MRLAGSTCAVYGLILLVPTLFIIIIIFSSRTACMRILWRDISRRKIEREVVSFGIF
jgi:hypothetical protein